MVGRPLGEPRSAVVSRREAQRYARAVGDLSPIYFDEDAARAAGYDGLVAPPTFVGHAVVEGGTLDERPHGRSVDRPRTPGAPGRVADDVRRRGVGVPRARARWRHDHGAAPVGAVEEKAGRAGPSCCPTSRRHSEPARRGRRRVPARRDRAVSGQRLLGDVAVGDELDAARRNASRAQLFLYSAATHNPHRIHYDRDYALVEGHPDVVTARSRARGSASS